MQRTSDAGTRTLALYNIVILSASMPQETWEKYYSMKIFRIDGEKFSTLEEFYDEISRVVIPGADWGHNLDALNDILRGGFGTPDEGFILIWENAQTSRRRLGYPETVSQLERRLKRSHDREGIEAQLRNAQNNKGATVFDWLVGIIRDHGVDGDQSESNVTLELR